MSLNAASAPRRTRISVRFIDMRVPASCADPGDAIHAEVVGLVTAVTPGAARIRMYTLSDGTVVTIDGAKATDVKGSGNASVGDLVLTDHAGTWLSSLRISTNADAPPGCFGLLVSGVDDGDYIKFTNGLRLPKAAHFDHGLALGTFGTEYGTGLTFCVDASGAVTRYGIP
jgi:hypothetical protein